MSFIAISILLLVALILFLSVKLNWISSDNLQIIANIAAIVALFAAALVFIIPAPTAIDNNTLKTEEANTISQLVLQSDNFSDSGTGWTTSEGYWSIYDYKDDRFYIHFDGNGDSSIFASWTNAGKFSDVGIQVTMLGPFDIKNDNAKRGIGFGSPNGDKNGVYVFTVNTKGECQISQYKESEYGILQTLLSNATTQFDPSISHHILRLEVKYREATGYLNDEVCITQILPEYQAGYIGLFATASYGGTDYVGGESYFDDFIIYQLP